MDQSILKKRFFRKYQEFLDRDLLRISPKKYIEKLNRVSTSLEGIRFDRNVLIICNQDISREVFLCGFSKLDEYKSFKFYNVEDLMDIYFDRRGYDSVSSGLQSQEEGINSCLDIRQDVLCLTMNYHETVNKKSDEVCVSTIQNRIQKSSRSVRPKWSWVFSKGDMSRYPYVWNLFKETEEICGIHEIRVSGIVGGSTTSGSTTGHSSTVSTGSNSELDDLY